jgi:hypothetical protein
MIVKIKLKIENEERTMLFGNSYKFWHQQFREYCIAIKNVKVINVQSSPDDWISWEGLKWSNETMFQDFLNREYCKTNEDNPNPRQYGKMHFKQNPIAFNIARKIAQIIDGSRR